MYKIIHDIKKNGIKQDINFLIWVKAIKSFFPVKTTDCFYSKIAICMLVMPNSSFIQGRIKKFSNRICCRLFGGDSFFAMKGVLYLSAPISLIFWWKLNKYKIYGYQRRGLVPLKSVSDSTNLFGQRCQMTYKAIWNCKAYFIYLVWSIHLMGY